MNILGSLNEVCGPQRLAMTLCLGPDLVEFLTELFLQQLECL